MNKPHVGDTVRFDGQTTKVIDRLVISETVHLALKGSDGINAAVPSQSVEWNGRHFIVNPKKLVF
ncbi:hypothetical protein EV207_10888 [Scopulibacillus darangshiensis]|uniref:Uncharacterized protein n=1 Tax=Scopulibacillus darangshiensis TaxID=442528 RepID=A0A4V2SN54_9BACL|nr:hypothetical protein [Scopulibacillus darangshiensis]TCP29796.1 hypothetical protein EV207_10888 [Scopulibacillus darangshiensis]